MKNSTKLTSRIAALCGVVLFASTTFANGSLTNPIETATVDIENELDQVDPLQLTVTPFMYNGGVSIRCNGTNTGRVSVATIGGVAPYTYSWSHNATFTGTLALGLFAGNYSVTVTDAAGTSVTEAYTLVENSPLVATVSATEIACNGGTSTVTTSASGGTSPYNGVNVVTRSAGSFPFTVSDANGCRSVLSITITEPDVLVATASQTAPILCYGETGEVTVEAVGGTLPYSGAGAIAKTVGSHDFVVTDANGCTSDLISVTLNQPGQVTATATNTPIGCYGETCIVTVSVSSGVEPYAGDGDYVQSAGTYTYDVMDYNGCPAQATVVITQPELLIAEAASDMLNCNAGTASVSVSGMGGVTPYVGTGLYTGSIGTNTTYTVTDANGCTTNVDYLPGGSSIKANVTPSYYMIDCMPHPVLIEAFPTDGVAPYTYLWSTGETTSSISVSPNVTTVYDVTITDAYGCVVSTNGDGATVDVINRCGNNNQKIVICHVPSGEPENPQTICISPNALDPHMQDAWNLHGGDYCGPCQESMSITLDEANNGDNNFISVGYNTNNETVELSYRLSYDSDVRVEIYDMTGALVETIHQGNATEGQLYELAVSPSKFTSGVYLYQFVTDTERHIDKLHFIH